MCQGLCGNSPSKSSDIKVTQPSGCAGVASATSIGASVEESEYIRPNQKALVNGREFVGPVNVVRKATLGEISFVDLQSKKTIDRLFLNEGPLGIVLTPLGDKAYIALDKTRLIAVLDMKTRQIKVLGYDKQQVGLSERFSALQQTGFLESEIIPVGIPGIPAQKVQHIDPREGFIISLEVGIKPLFTYLPPHLNEHILLKICDFLPLPLRNIRTYSRIRLPHGKHNVLFQHIEIGMFFLVQIWMFLGRIV